MGAPPPLLSSALMDTLVYDPVCVQPETSTWSGPDAPIVKRNSPGVPVTDTMVASGSKTGGKQNYCESE